VELDLRRAQTQQKFANSSRIHEDVDATSPPRSTGCGLATRRSVSLADAASEPFIGLTREEYPDYYDYLSVTFSKVKQKPRVVEEHDSISGVMSSVEAGIGIAIGAEAFGYSFGNRVKLLHITPEPKPISIGIAAPKGRLSPAAEKSWECAKEAASPVPRPKALGARR
jgi:DNA-binding transcriptional LysR family regulator